MFATQRNYSLVLKEGWIFALIVMLIAIIIQHYSSAQGAAPLWFLVVFILFIYRDPKREIPSAPLALVSPADGVVVKIDRIQDPYLERTAIRIVVKMSFWDSYSTRSPTEGKIIKRWFHGPGQNNEGDHEDKNKSSLRFGIWVQTDEEDDVVMVMNRSKLFSMPQCYVQSGERIGQGQRCGFIRFGANVTVYVPENSKIDIHEGARVHAGTDIIATLIHK